MTSLRVTDFPSPNYDARSRAVDLVVLHYTGMHDGGAALKRLCDPAPLAGHYPGPWQDRNIDPMTLLGRVSAHYVVGEAGAVYRLVSEAHRAWHAGVSSWEGEDDVNGRSIGIEIVNGGHDFGLPDYPEPQINAVIALLQDIQARHGLGASRIVGHSDVAPGRKLDPGEKFPWGRLAQFGVALSPRGAAGGGEPVLKAGDCGPAVAALQRQLAAIGYGLEATGAYDERTLHCVRAFQARFRQDAVSGELDEETSRLVADIAAQSASA